MKYILLTVVALGLLSTCRMEPETEKADEGKILVSIQTAYTGGSERSVFPSVSLDDVDHYALWGAPVGTVETELIPSFTQNVSIALNAGTWNFTVKGYNGAGALILQGERKNQVVSLSSKSFSFALSPLLEGSGSILITITLPSGSGVTAVAVFKDGEEETPLPVIDDRITYSAASMAAGDYFYSFGLNNNEGNTLGVVSEIVQVRASLMSEKTIDLTQADINALPSMSEAPLVEMGNGQLTVSWTALPKIGDYEVYCGTTTTPPINPAQTVSNVTTTVISGLTNGTLYYVWVKAENTAGTSGFSPIASGTPIATPQAPTIATGNGQLVLNWTATAGASAYEVWIGTTSDSAQAAQWGSDVTDLFVTISGLDKSTTYYVWIKAKNSRGTSSFSPVTVCTPIDPPEAPTLTMGDGALAVSWTAVDGATAYEVWIGTTNDNALAAKYGTDISGLSVTITGLNNNTTYYVWIKAKNNSGGTSSFSPTASTLVVPNPLVTAGNSQLRVSWPAVDGATAYEVWIGTTNNSASATKYGADTSGLSVTISGLNNGTTYYVWVKAKNSGGTSDFSPMVSEKPIAPPPAPKPNVVISGKRQLTVIWPPEQSVTSYLVYYGTSSDFGKAAQWGKTTGTNVIITGLADGTLYYAWVVACNIAGNSSPSSPVSGTTAPAAPGTVTVTAGNTRLHVNWSSVQGATEYTVLYGTSSNSSGAMESSKTSGTSWDSGDLTNATYYVWIRAHNAAGSSDPGSSKTGKPRYEWKQFSTYTTSQPQLPLSASSSNPREYVVYLVGAGGGGEGSNIYASGFLWLNTSGGAGGGGGGGAAASYSFSTTKTGTASLSIGTGGPGGSRKDNGIWGATPGNPGEKGGNTIFSWDGNSITAGGGIGGGIDGGAGGTVIGSTTNGVTSVSGSKGGAGSSTEPNKTVAGGNAGSIKMVDGSTIGGAGGGNNTVAINGSKGGGGAGAAYGKNQSTGGKGGDGYAVIFYLEHN